MTALLCVLGLILIIACPFAMMWLVFRLDNYAEAREIAESADIARRYRAKHYPNGEGTMWVPVILVVILVLSASSAWALSDATIDYCLTTANPKQCLQDIQRDVNAAEVRNPGGPTYDQQAQLQRDLARQQALGMAAFGSGNALINGMNQGFRQMQVHPYILPPAQQYQTR